MDKKEQEDKKDWKEDFELRFNNNWQYDLLFWKKDVMDFISSLIEEREKEAYERGRKNPDVSVAGVLGFEAGCEQGKLEQREEIIAWAEKEIDIKPGGVIKVSDIKNGAAEITGKINAYKKLISFLKS